MTLLNIALQHLICILTIISWKNYFNQTNLIQKVRSLLIKLAYRKLGSCIKLLCSLLSWNQNLTGGHISFKVTSNRQSVKTKPRSYNKLPWRDLKSSSIQVTAGLQQLWSRNKGTCAWAKNVSHFLGLSA